VCELVECQGVEPPCYTFDNPCSCNLWISGGVGVIRLADDDDADCASLTPKWPAARPDQALASQNKPTEDLKMQENRRAAGALPRTPLGELTCPGPRLREFTAILSLRNDLFCVEWDVKPQLNQSTDPLAGGEGVISPRIRPPLSALWASAQFPWPPCSFSTTHTLWMIENKGCEWLEEKATTGRRNHTPAR